MINFYISKQLKAPKKDFFNWFTTEESFLKNGAVSYHATDTDREVSLICGDYFFTEAIYKLKRFESGGGHILGQFILLIQEYVRTPNP